MRKIIMEKNRCTYSECSAFEPSMQGKTYTVHLYKLKFIASLETYTPAIICTHNLTYYINGGRSTFFFRNKYILGT